jgi:hypothetical protein
MTKWTLLAFTCVAVYGVVDTVRWLRRLRDPLPKDNETANRNNGLYLTSVRTEQRTNRPKQVLAYSVMVFMTLIALTFIGMTAAAFLSG